MARKPASRVAFTLFDVVYEDGSQRSNRRVPTGVFGGPDGDAAARVVIEEQDLCVPKTSEPNSGSPGSADVLKPLGSLVLRPGQGAAIHELGAPAYSTSAHAPERPTRNYQDAG
jgi:hypothetical protein